MTPANIARYMVFFALGLLVGVLLAFAVVRLLG